jgi:hypothetical protein
MSGRRAPIPSGVVRTQGSARNAGLTVRAAGGNFYAVREPELGVATTNVPEVVFEIMQQVNQCTADGHLE